MKKVINTKNSPQAIGCYSQAVVSGYYMFISGQIPIDPKTGNLINAPFEKQVRQVLDNIQNILIVENLSFDSIVKLSVFLVNLSNIQVLNDIFEEYFFGFSPPARSVVEVNQLPKNSQLEIDVIAHINE